MHIRPHGRRCFCKALTNLPNSPSPNTKEHMMPRIPLTKRTIGSLREEIESLEKDKQTYLQTAFLVDRLIQNFTDEIERRERQWRIDCEKKEVSKNIHQASK